TPLMAMAWLTGLLPPLVAGWRPLAAPAQSSRMDLSTYCGGMTRSPEPVASREHATEQHARPLAELIDPGWAGALAPVTEQIRGMGDFLRAELVAGRSYLPHGNDVLRAFTHPISGVRVLIVGQDPYPTQGHAVGLSFSVRPDVRPVPRSLDNIYRELS